jgi:SAM domain (Sterile alpha motif)
VLPELTEADLEKLGVLLGHRKKLLKAIAALAGRRRLRRPGKEPAGQGRDRAVHPRRSDTALGLMQLEAAHLLGAVSGERPMKAENVRTLRT